MKMKICIIFFAFFIALISSTYANALGMVHSQTDEFVEVTDSSDEFKTVNDADEFKEVSDSEFTKVESDSLAVCGKSCQACDLENKFVNDLLLIFLFTAIAGICVRFKTLRNLRGLFMLGSIIYLGFLNGPCPCMISSFENFILFIGGADLSWTSYLWFLGLIPLTYIFGRVWCGWVCHLGAIQEFIHIPKKWNFLKGYKSQRVLRVLSWFFTATLIVQLLITKDLFWCKIDPFVSIFSLKLDMNNKYFSVILVGLILITSLFTYRPFCKGACPVGLILGWISLIPGASVIGTNKKCIGCRTCFASCQIDAISRVHKVSTLDNKECIGCGDCISSCKKGGNQFFRKNKIHKTKITCSSTEL